MKNTLVCAFALLLAALPLAGCGGEQAQVKTPEEQLAEELALAEEEARRRDDDLHRFDEATTDSEEAAQFDQRQAELELKRATRSAQDCPGSLPEEERKLFQKGVATVTLTFSNEGRVKQRSISSNYDDTAVGTCVLRAMGAVIVPVYQGPEKTIEWEVDLTGDPEASAEEAKKSAK
ncbi:MAG: hypothetical protein GX607_12870 [Myxococcales bacterium]|jgi:hypothetical protein|nr:hypothetical protein [Myxococcales bacterium]